MFDMLTSPYTHPLKKLIWMRLKAGARAVWETISGNPVSFTAKAAPLRQLSVAFSPVQSLNGYDAPWPAGGGANIMPTIPAGTYTSGNITAVVSNNGLITVTGSKEAGTDNTITFPALESAFALPLDSYVHLRNSAAVTGVTLGIGGSAPSINPANRIFQNTIERTPSVVVNLYFRSDVEGTFNFTLQPSVELTGSVTDWTPYSNECPISGWSSLTVEQRGVNLWDEETESGYINPENGNLVSDANKIRMKNYIPVLPNTTYYKHCGKNTDGTAQMFWNVYYDADKHFISYGNPSSGTFTTPANCHYIRSGFETAYGTTYKHDISVNYPSTDTAYHAYNPLSRSISISLGQTVYSGWVDVVTGVGEINWVKDVYDGSSDEVWGYTISETPAAFYTQISYPANNPQSMGNYLKRVTAFGAVSGFSYIIHSNQIRVSDMGGECADTTQAGAIAKLRAYLAANPFEVVHKITTPIPIQLTPQEVESLAGDNTMFTPCDSLTVEYRSN